MDFWEGFLLGRTYIQNKDIKKLNERINELEQEQIIPREKRDEIINQYLSWITKLEKAGLGNKRIKKVKKILENNELPDIGDLDYIAGKYSVLSPYLTNISDEYKTAIHNVRISGEKAKSH